MKSGGRAATEGQAASQDQATAVAAAPEPTAPAKTVLDAYDAANGTTVLAEAS